MKNLVLSSIFLIVLGMFSAAQAEAPAVSESGKAAGANNEFALSLYSCLRGKSGNFFFSPVSLSPALTMVYGGARGITEKEMARVLCLEAGQKDVHSAFSALSKELLSTGEGVTFTAANALWGQKGLNFLPDYLALLKQYYGAAVFSVDFRRNTEEARKKINIWTEKKTRQKIQNLLKPGILQPATELVLTNAVYFYGKWAAAFKKEATKEAPFTLLSGKEVPVPLMFQEGTFPYYEDETMQAISLSYGKGDYSLMVLLPKKNNGLPELEKALSIEMTAPRLSRKKVRLFLPKFRLESEFSLAETLKKMGMKTAFSSSANFSGMTGKRGLFISAVIHKAFVDVTEEGTEAAAATAVVMMKGAFQREAPPVFKADHPFLFFIRHNPSGSLLFMGRMEEPNK